MLAVFIIANFAKDALIVAAFRAGLDLQDVRSDLQLPSESHISRCQRRCATDVVDHHLGITSSESLTRFGCVSFLCASISSIWLSLLCNSPGTLSFGMYLSNSKYVATPQTSVAATLDLSISIWQFVQHSLT